MNDKEIDSLRDKLKALFYRNKMLEIKIRETEQRRANNDIMIDDIARRIKKIEEGK